jgi:hypothetical protein
MMEFRVVSQVESVDVPGIWHRSTQLDSSVIPIQLTQQIPIVAPVRTRVVEFGKSGDGDSRQSNGNCILYCPETSQFPWTIKINGERAHSLNANRISMVIV